ncbi:MAG: prepilin-type N-terminal cleavage/methylation domain-containing protein [Gammaproteobacteria bacterium]|nr:prepilin-type N-terminal cleavage/methylation domain-containing protein [Gammaproteobacteria bacterium]MCI0590387.1 prepilin-type N-terminal cleavage/methylation domain-containing protein [Gammaproteobacteria bacterium]
MVSNKMTRQSGFTLVELAIVLVIIGLLLGGILKGQELINSARVRNVADMNSGIQAAYYGFIDRYRQVPGDMNAALATQAIGQAIANPTAAATVGNGQIDAGNWDEASAAWEHLSKAGFIQGLYPGGATTAAAYQVVGVAPVNALNGALLLARSADYSDTAAPAQRLNLVLGDNIPVNIARELDVKVDDGLPLTGVLRYTGTSPMTNFDPVSAATSTNCITAAAPIIWDIANDAQNCNLAFLY